MAAAAWEIVARYSRADALADGALVDCSALARELGFAAPVAVTREAWADLVAWSDADSRRQVPQDETGRLWDVLWMARGALVRAIHQARTCGGVSSRHGFDVWRVRRGGRGVTPRSVRAVVVADSDGAVVMLDGES